ncbi:hypothetical protein [Chondromyces crocatus]|uniref:Uncharacterized protein n=1 Tax=Chondromyces crocatus TaxID=52 RepID=A0A0K1ECI6_CHOCO|nr:hypothetical protein [Chondromyces crocatus]AKT38575.1 uncharacterized protein CMC5_027220 [Chondromyces crocatus]
MAGAYASPPPGAIPFASPSSPQAPQTPQAPPTPQAPQSFEQKAGQAVQSVGNALVSGFKELGTAFDSFTRTAPRIGSAVLVVWSDGKHYPGTVAQLGSGSYLVTMRDGRQHWIPEGYVKPA